MNLLGCSHALTHYTERKDNTRFDNYQVKYVSLTQGRSVPFLESIVWNPWVSMKVGFFTWETILEKDFKFWSAQKEELECSEHVL